MLFVREAKSMSCAAVLFWRLWLGLRMEAWLCRRRLLFASCGALGFGRSLLFGGVRSSIAAGVVLCCLVLFVLCVVCLGCVFVVAAAFDAGKPPWLSPWGLFVGCGDRI